MRNYANYTNEDIIKYAAEVKSIAGLLNKLGLRPVGGNYATMKKKLQLLKVDCDHWTGQGWSAGERLKDWENYSKPDSVKKHLILERGHQCEQCNLSSWLNESIPLEIHHINGDRTNNCPDNLHLLCCNCHALTPNWRNKPREVKPVVKYGLDQCSGCDGQKKKISLCCRACDNKKRKLETR